MDIKKYEQLAKLNLDETERQWVSNRVIELVGTFSELDNVDTTGFDPLITVLDIQNILRDDVSQKLINREELLANAPDQYDGYFRLPKVLD